MKSKIHVFSRMFTKKGSARLASVNIFLFIIFAVLAVQSAWADCNPNGSICGSAGSYYTNVPSTGKNTVYLDADMSSINIRNERVQGRYLPNSKGTLVLVAPEGYVLQASYGDFDVLYSGNILNGNAKYDYSDYVAIYDGNTTKKDHRLFKSGEKCSFVNGSAVVTSGREMTIYFYSDGSHEGYGLNITVTLHKVDMEVECSNTGSGLSCGAKLLPRGSYTLTLPDPLTTGVNKFHIDGSVYPNTSSVLNITAPEGYMMELTGYFSSTYSERIKISCYRENCNYYDQEIHDDRLYATIYDPDNAVWLSLRYLSTLVNGKLYSSGRHLTLSLNSKDNPKAHVGILDLTVTLRKINMDIKSKWGDDSQFLGYYVNMYAKNRAYLSIPRDVENFTVYDDGGENGDYSNYAGAALELEAPEGRYLQVSGGFVKTGAGDSLIIYDGVYTEVWKGKNTYNIPSIQSSDRKMTLVFKSDATGTYKGFKLDVKVRHSAEGTLSLDQNKIVRDTSVFRDASYSLYAKMTSIQKYGFDAKLQCRYETARGWSDWGDVTNVNYGGLNSPSNYSYNVEITPEAKNTSGKLCSPSNAVESQFRMRVIPWELSTGEHLVDTAFTDTVSVKFKNKVVVDTKITKTLSGDYAIFTKSGLKINKEDGVPSNTEIVVQAIPPAVQGNPPVRYKFTGWDFSSSNKDTVSLTVMSDTTLRAFFEPDVQDMKVVTFVSKNDTATWSSAENSPLDVDVISATGGKFRVKASILASAELCNKACYAYIIIRKEGSDTWDTIQTNSSGQTVLSYIKISSNNSYSINPERIVPYNLFKNAQRFEIKTIVKKTISSSTNIAESNSIYANLYHTLQVKKECFDGGGTTRYYGCGAIVEDEMGNMKRLTENEKIVRPYGTKLKLHPLYPYDQNFWMWKVFSLENSEFNDPENYFTKDSVCEFTLDSNMQFVVGVVYRNLDVVQLTPENQVMPYVGMTEFNLLHSNEGSNGFKFASDTAFYIDKYVWGQGWVKFAVNKLDSMFTPGQYELNVKLVNESTYETERDSLWACNSYPATYLMDEFLPPYVGSSVECSETSLAVHHRRYQFTLNDTTFNVVFKKWDEKAGEYVEAETQKVAFGATPTAPNVECPESNASWDISCEWSSKIVPAYNDAEYLYELKGVQKKAVVFETVNEKYTAIINGDFSGESRVDFPVPVEVDSIAYNRTFTPQTPATVVLPFDLPEGTTVNAKFYYLESVVQKGRSWKATMTNIGAGNLPVANTPYAVIVPNGDKLEFNLSGKATFQTDDIFSTKVSDGNWQFVGVYSYKVWEEGDKELGLAYAFAGSNNDGGAAKGEFGKIKHGGSTNPYANPLRAYLRKTSESVQLELLKGRSIDGGEKTSPASVYSADLPETIDVEFIDENEKTMFTSRMNTRTGEFEMLREYDIKGRKLNGKSTARNAYYGKKIIKK